MPTILWSWVRIPSTPSTLFPFLVKFCWGKDDNKQKKRPSLAHLKNIVCAYHFVVLGSNPKHTIYDFPIYSSILLFVNEQTINKKRPSLAHYKNPLTLFRFVFSSVSPSFVNMSLERRFQFWEGSLTVQIKIWYSEKQTWIIFFKAKGFSDCVTSSSDSLFCKARQGKESSTDFQCNRSFG